MHAGVLEPLRQAERRLPAELADHAGDRAGLRLRVHDLEHVLEGERLEVEPVGGVVVGRDGLGVAVDHHGLVAGVVQRQAGVHARVVELDALPDPVGPGAEDDHRLLLARRDLGLLVVGAVVVRRARGELGGAGVDRLVDRADAERVPHAADDVLLHVADPAELRVGEPVPLGPAQQRGRQLVGVDDLLGDLVDQAQLVDEPRVDAGGRRGSPPRSPRRAGRPSPCAAGRRAACGSPRAASSLSSSTSQWLQSKTAFLSSRLRSAFCSASVKLRPIAIASPTDFMCVVSVGSAAGNFSNANRGTFTTT